MEALNSRASINLTKIMIVHIIKTCDMKDQNHGLGYVFFIPKVFDYFLLNPYSWTYSTKKHKFSLTPLKKYECVKNKEGEDPTTYRSCLITN